MRYTGYGERSATLGPVHPTDLQWAGGWGYQTEWSDATDPGIGLVYVQNRYYEPATGRWVSNDPLGWVDGPNLYEYCGGNPVTLVDPRGTDAYWYEVPAGDYASWIERKVRYYNHAYIYFDENSPAHLRGRGFGFYPGGIVEEGHDLLVQRGSHRVVRSESNWQFQVRLGEVIQGSISNPPQYIHPDRLFSSRPRPMYVCGSWARDMWNRTYVTSGIFWKRDIRNYGLRFMMETMERALIR